MWVVLPPPLSEVKKFPLIDHLMRYSETRGLRRLLAISQLREYCYTVNPKDLLVEIQAIWDEEHLNALIAVGLKGVLYFAVIGQKARIEGLI